MDQPSRNWVCAKLKRFFNQRFEFPISPGRTLKGGILSEHWLAGIYFAAGFPIEQDLIVSGIYVTAFKKPPKWPKDTDSRLAQIYLSFRGITFRSHLDHANNYSGKGFPLFRNPSYNKRLTVDFPARLVKVKEIQEILNGIGLASLKQSEDILIDPYYIP